MRFDPVMAFKGNKTEENLDKARENPESTEHLSKAEKKAEVETTGSAQPAAEQATSEEANEKPNAGTESGQENYSEEAETAVSDLKNNESDSWLAMNEFSDSSVQLRKPSGSLDNLQSKEKSEVSSATNASDSADDVLELEKNKNEMKILESALQGHAIQAQAEAAIAKLMYADEQLKAVIEDLKETMTRRAEARAAIERSLIAQLHVLNEQLSQISSRVKVLGAQKLETKIAAQFAVDATHQRVHTAQKDDIMPLVEATSAPLEAPLGRRALDMIIDENTVVFFDTEDLMNSFIGSVLLEYGRDVFRLFALVVVPEDEPWDLIDELQYAIGLNGFPIALVLNYNDWRLFSPDYDAVVITRTALLDGLRDAWIQLDRFLVVVFYKFLNWAFTPGAFLPFMQRYRQCPIPEQPRVVAVDVPSALHILPYFLPRDFYSTGLIEAVARVHMYLGTRVFMSGRMVAILSDDDIE